jgi:hypothetical protein
MVDWSRPLTRVLVLKSGKHLTTLLGAADLIAGWFQTAMRDHPLEHTIRLLLRAAETGTRKDRKAAAHPPGPELSGRRWRVLNRQQSGRSERKLVGLMSRVRPRARNLFGAQRDGRNH